MPALPNRRQELFCQKVAQGIPPIRAYPEAGYSPHNGNCYRMRDNERVQQRLIELTGTAEVEFLASRDRILQELASVAYTPIGNADVKTSDKNNALMNMAKIAGLLIERKEIGRVGEFDRMSNDELLEYIDVTYREIASIAEGEGSGGDEEVEGEEIDGDLV